MVEFYEYFFYRMYWYYVEKGKEDIGNEILSCSFGMTLFQSLNYIFVFEFIRYLLLGYRYGNIWEYWIPVTIILVCDYLYFSRKGRKDRIIQRYKNISKQRKIKLDIILIIYMIFSFIFFMFISYMIANNLTLNKVIYCITIENIYL